MQLTYKHLRDENFGKTMERLAMFQGFKIKTTIKLAKIMRGLKEEAKTSQESFVALVNKYALKDANGQILPKKEGEKEIPGTFDIAPENQAAFEQEYADFCATTFELPQDQINPEDLQEARLSANEIAAIEAVIRS